MGIGVALMVVGAILAFAVDDHVPNISLGTVGLILMLAGAAVIAHARHGSAREKVVTRIEEPASPDAPAHVTREIVEERSSDPAPRE